MAAAFVGDPVFLLDLPLQRETQHQHTDGDAKEAIHTKPMPPPPGHFWTLADLGRSEVAPTLKDSL